HAGRGRAGSHLVARARPDDPAAPGGLLGGEPDLPLERVPLAPGGDLEQRQAGLGGRPPVVYPPVRIRGRVGTDLRRDPHRHRAVDRAVRPVPAAVHRILHPVGSEGVSLSPGPAAREASMKRRALLATVILALVGGFAPMAQAQTKLQFYYPVGVAGPLARMIDGYVQEWNKTHPQVQVEAVFTGNYTESYAKTLAAIQAGTPPDVAIMLSQNLNDIISQNIVIPLDELIAADAAQMKMDD